MLAGAWLVQGYADRSAPQLPYMSDSAYREWGLSVWQGTQSWITPALTWPMPLAPWQLWSATPPSPNLRMLGGMLV